MAFNELNPHDLPPTVTSVASGGTSPPPPHLRRVLSVWNLALYGIVVVTPAAAMFNFGVISRVGHGHFPISILIALAPMLLTAYSYGRLASIYPNAGSAFTYVTHEIGPVTGNLVGWSLVMDYLLIPLAAIIWCSQQAHDLLPAIPYGIWATAFTSVLTVLNLQAVNVSARFHTVLVGVISIVVFIFLIAATVYVAGHPHDAPGFFSRPFYDPLTWDRNAILAGASIAVLTYMGFDSISTLAEEVENPRRSIFFAMMLACVFTGFLSVVEGYLAQLVWPISDPYPNVDTAFTFVAQRVWAPLFGIVGLTLVIASFGSALATQMAAARLLYGMGRSEVLPTRIFGMIDPKRHVPRNNVLIVGGLILFGTFALPELATKLGDASAFELAANLLNFGALIGFMGVHAAALRYFFFRSPRKRVVNLVIPVLGFFACGLLWWNLSLSSHLLGGLWLAMGAVLGLWSLQKEKRQIADQKSPRVQQR